MKNQDQKRQAQKTQTVQGFIANPQVFLNEDRETITHRLYTFFSTLFCNSASNGSTELAKVEIPIFDSRNCESDDS